MALERFQIVFQKLNEEVPSTQEKKDQGFVALEISKAEFDAIDELRQAVLEITDPEPKLYTTS